RFVIELRPLSRTRILPPLCSPLVEIVAAVLCGVLAQYADDGAVLGDHLNATDGDPGGLLPKAMQMLAPDRHVPVRQRFCRAVGARFGAGQNRSQVVARSAHTSGLANGAAGQLR